jgi:hypothetical protein
MSQQPSTVTAHPAGPPAAARAGSPGEWQTARLTLLDRERK